jgi:hypothetical protein
MLGGGDLGNGVWGDSHCDSVTTRHHIAVTYYLRIPEETPKSLKSSKNRFIGQLYELLNSQHHHITSEVCNERIL